MNEKYHRGYTIVREVSQKEKDKHHVITYIWNLKHDTNDFIYELKSMLIPSQYHLITSNSKNVRSLNSYTIHVHTFY